MSVHTTACPRNCYSTCGLRVTVEAGRVVAIDPHPGNQATAEGACLKGLSYLERCDPANRLLSPMLRQPDGTFQAIGWEAALDLMSERFLDLRARYGAQSVMYYAGSGTKGLLNGVGMAFWRAFGGCTTSYGDLCWPAGLEATRLTLGDNRGSAPWDLAEARLVLLWGKNPAETNVHQMRFLDQALAAGARCVVVDPRRTESAERAHVLIQPRPGSDGALALGVAAELVRNGWIDQAFIDAHVHGFEAFAASLKDWDLARTEAATGVPARFIAGLAHDLGHIRPATLVAGYGMQRYSNAGQTMRALLALLALTGNLGRPGAGWAYANLQSDVFSAVKDPLDCYPPERPDGVVRVSLSAARLGRDMAAQADPPLMGAWVERGNPLSQNPETPAVRAAFRALRFRVVVDERLTDTAREADLVLPAKTLFEQTDVIGAYWHSYLQIRQKVVEPPGLVKPESEVYRLLAERMGLDASGLPGIGDAATEAWLEHRLAPFPGLSLAALREGPVLAPGVEAVAFADLAFPTPSGKVELRSEEAARRWGVDPLPGWTPPVEWAADAGPYPLQFLTPNHKNSIHSQFHDVPVIRALDPGPALMIGPGDALARGLKDGDPVRVFNDRGELRLPARIDPGLRPGVVAAFNGYGADRGGSVNLLSLGRETDMGHGAAFHDNRVQVERAR